MKKNKEIAKKITNYCSDAKSFLTEKEALINERLAYMDKWFSDIETAELTEEEKKAKNSELEKLDEELYLFEVNENDLMVENLFMCDVSNELSKFLGGSLISFENKGKFIDSKKEVLTEKNKRLEEVFSKIDTETNEKKVARRNIVESEKALERFNAEYVNFEGMFKGLTSAISKKESEIEKERLVLSDMEAKFNEDQDNYGDAFLNFKAAHRETVDSRLVVNNKKKNQSDLDVANKMFKTNTHELNDVNEKVATSEDELQNISDSEKEESKKVSELNKELDVFERKLMVQEELISKLEKENSWLKKQTSDKKIKIDSLEDKLTAWKENYKEFKLLVEKIEAKIGYVGVKSSFDGDKEPNPLTDLIKRVEAINEWLENYEPPTPPNPPIPEPIKQLDEPIVKNGISPYLVGVIALGAIAVLTIKK